MVGRTAVALVAVFAIAAMQVGGSRVEARQQSLLAEVGEGAVQQTTSLITKSHAEVIANLKKDAENQKKILAEKSRRRSGGDDTSAHSMSPHLSHHAARGEEAGSGHRGRSAAQGKVGVQQSIHGVLKLPPDEATPFFDTYVLKYAFPTIALICSCLACILFRTMRMYQKERWKGTSYFHGARRSAESLLPGLK
uniref:Uncharacterized protein n=1 Tax=Hemiselmis andersenii TaxID=464988 RepID=A0A6U2GTH2_HEMAN